MKILITGGAGFIGANTAHYFAGEKENKITIVDNCSRPGVEDNADFLLRTHKNIELIRADVQNTRSYLNRLKQADVIIHLAGQTAVTTSIANPRLDFTSNVIGTFELLEAVRTENPDAIVLYASTNKVYGDLRAHRFRLNREEEKYENLDFPEGIGEGQPLEFISPYGCSKGAMDAYMEDYARIYGMKTVVFRQSCIYGPFQMGVEDQGWVAHFSKQFLLAKPITIFGDGYQVRDLLAIEDLIAAYVAAIENIDTARGHSFTIGGGPGNAYSLRQVIKILESVTGTTVPVNYSALRFGDQKYFVSSNAKMKEMLGWEPKIGFLDGVHTLVSWQRSYLKV